MPTCIKLKCNFNFFIKIIFTMRFIVFTSRCFSKRKLQHGYTFFLIGRIFTYFFNLRSKLKFYLRCSSFTRTAILTQFNVSLYILIARFASIYFTTLSPYCFVRIRYLLHENRLLLLAEM